MSELMVEAGGASMQEEQQQRHRRPRVREVSSRFMSPVVSSSSSGDLHLLAAKSPLPKQQQQRSTSAQSRRHLELEALDENTFRSSETPFQSGSQSSRKHQRAAVKLFKENNNGADGTKFSGRTLSSSRPDTPTVGRLRLTAHSFHRSSNTPTATAAAKLLQSSLSCSSQEAAVNSSSSSLSVGGDDNNNDDNAMKNCDLRSSMPEADSFKFFASPCSRSLNMSLSSSEHSLFHHSIKGNERPTSSSGLSRSYSNSVKMGGLCLPPVPPCAKLGTDARKGRKVSSHQEDLHSLKLLHNHYLQWRFANAKAEASMKAQKREAEKLLYSLGVKISDLSDSVKRKRMELGLLQRTKTLSTIIEAQMPYLDEWSAFEGKYSVSLSEAIQALLNSSLHLPTTGNVKADKREVVEALNSATRMMEMIVSNVQSFMPKAEEMEKLISELARVTGGERALVGECGDLLSRTHTKQVEECSLRGQLIQLQRSCPAHPCEK